MEEEIFLPELANFSEKFRKYSKSFFQKKGKPFGSYPPLVGGLYKNLEDFGQGGKALRPFLVYLGYKTFGGRRIKKIMPICLAYELLHDFLLIHDDIIDKSDVRRGKPTIHKRYEKFFGEHYGQSQAIILGDIACFEALRLINSAPFGEEIARKAWDKIVQTLLETAYGEALDVEYSYKKASLSAIWQVADLKSARYTFVGPLSVGAILAGADDRRLDAIGRFGQSLGLAYQLHDDILGVFQDEKISGKSALSDLSEGKNTVLIYKTRQLVMGRDRSVLAVLWGKRQATERDLETVCAIIKRSGALKWVQDEKQRLASEAQSLIKSQTFDFKLQKLCSQLCEFVITRES